MKSYSITTDYGREVLLTQNFMGKPQLTVKDISTTGSITVRLPFEQAKELGEKLIEFSAVTPKFYLKIMDKYVNYDTCDGRYFLASAAETGILKTQFTLKEINNEPKLKEFAEYKIPVNSAVSW